jgi:uncharacterized membrane protein YgcG
VRTGSTYRYAYASPAPAAGEWRRALPLAIVVGALLALTGACATMGGNPLGTGETPAQKAQEIIPMLQTAGFDAAPATTPSEIDQLKSLPPLKLGYFIDKNGDAQYWMADPDDCKCIMHGDEAAYQRYENLKLENEVAERDRRAMENQQQQQGMGMGMGGPGMGMGFGNGGFGGGGFGFGGGGVGLAF